MTSRHSRTPGEANGDAKQRQGPVTRVTSPRRPGCVLTLLLHARRYQPATAVTRANGSSGHRRMHQCSSIPGGRDCETLAKFFLHSWYPVHLSDIYIDEERWLQRS